MREAMPFNECEGYSLIDPYAGIIQQGVDSSETEETNEFLHYQNFMRFDMSWQEAGQYDYTPVLVSVTVHWLRREMFNIVQYTPEVN